MERSLFTRAIGYEHDEIDIRVVDHVIVKTDIRKLYPPDTTACIFWLKNRRPDLWREKIEQETKHSGKVELEHSKRPKLTRDEWLKLNGIAE